MGKRRTEFEHKDPHLMNSDDDDEDEEDQSVEPEPLTQDQREHITKRKKLVPKRKFASGASSIPTDSVSFKFIYMYISMFYFFLTKNKLLPLNKLTLVQKNQEKSFNLTFKLLKFPQKSKFSTLK